jgi:hypothetical protein
MGSSRDLMRNRNDWQLNNRSFEIHSSYDYEAKCCNNKIKKEKGGNHEETS